MEFLSTKEWKEIPAIIRSGIILLFLEAFYILYWFGTMIYIVVNDNSTESHRTFHAFIAIHMLITPAALLYVIESYKKKLYWYLIWAFVGLGFFDLYGVLDAILHLDSVTKPTAYNIELAGSIWLFTMSCLEITWYISVKMWVDQPKEFIPISMPPPLTVRLPSKLPTFRPRTYAKRVITGME